MRRSEAVKLMVAFEEQAFKRFGYSLSRTEIMDGILFQLEKAGMLPPTVAVTKSVSGDLTSNISAKVSYSSKIHEWEPEDE